MTGEPAQRRRRVGARDSWHRGWLAFNELAVHTLIILFVISCIGSVEWFIVHTHGGGEMVFFKDGGFFQFPASWLFDVADIAMIGALLTRGVIAVNRVYRDGGKIATEGNANGKLDC
jgi:hypothetical protein